MSPRLTGRISLVYPPSQFAIDIVASRAVVRVRESSSIRELRNHQIQVISLEVIELDKDVC